jgi:hypothetical protein
MARLRDGLAGNSMQNEFATFGLPSDQPAQPRPRGWFARNLWWLLPTAILVVVVPIGCCVGIFVWLIGSLKSSEPYQMALERVRADRQVIEKLGEPVEASDWIPTGNFSHHVNNGVASGEVTFDFNVSGPKGTGRVHAEAVCQNGKWRLRLLQVTPEGGGEIVTLPNEDRHEG